MKMKNLFLLSAFFGLLSCQKPVEHLLVKSEFRHYFDKFNREDTLDLHLNVIPGTRMIPNEQSVFFLEQNIPFLECPDKKMEEVYYYRWWTFRKHIKETPEGYVITEFMPNVSWAGKHNTIPCPAGHHFREGRWLRDPQIITDYGLFWLREGGDPYRYSFWISDSFMRFFMVHPNDSLMAAILPDLSANFREWEKRRRAQDGLFWQYDGQDGMEVAIGGTGKRPTINTYMFADARALFNMADICGDSALSATYAAEAQRIQALTLKKLWDPAAEFFKVMPEGADALASARELLGYVPWYLELVPSGQGYEGAWSHLMDPEGFYAPWGPTTAEQRHPGFRVSYEGHECQWNGPSWPFATAQTLTALANVLNNYPQDVVGAEDYLELLRIYTGSHRFRQVPPRGDTIISNRLWIDENLNPFNGDWLARTRMEVQGHNHKFRERGIYYNHSTYCDLIITGVAGIRPSMDHRLTINPLLPEDWDWFCLDHVYYQGHQLTIVWDRNGDKYHAGKGFLVIVDGKMAHRSPALCKVDIVLE